MAVYLAYFIKPLRKFWRNILAILAVILVIELVEIITGSGSFDIDDVILNSIGAMIGYWFWRIKPIQWITEKLQLK